MCVDDGSTDASLGEGRLSRARVEICRRCFAGTAVADVSVETRLARLVAGEMLEVTGRSRRDAAAWIGQLPSGPRHRLVAFLDTVLVHGWPGVWGAVTARHEPPAAEDVLRSLLRASADRWALGFPGAEHLVFGHGAGAALDPARQWAFREEQVRLLNGSRAVVVRG